MITANDSMELKPVTGRRKARAVSDAVRQLAVRKGPGWKLPTAVELCNSLNVAYVTLDSALYDLEKEGLIERKRGSGVYVSPTVHQKTMGLVYHGDIFQAGVSPFCAELVAHARRRATVAKEKFHFYMDLPTRIHGVSDHDDLMDDLRAGRLHGLMMVGQPNQLTLQWVLDRKLPVAILGYTTADLPRLALDYGHLVAIGVDCLAQAGCRQIGLVTPFGWKRSVEAAFGDDLAAFQQALVAAGRPYRPEFVWEDLGVRKDAESETNQEAGYRAMKDIFEKRATSSSRPDGLVIADDMMTKGALVALERLGLRVGQDVKIASHANKDSDVLGLHAESLRLVEFDLDEMVEAMFRLLEPQMEGKSLANRVITIRPRLASAYGRTGTELHGEVPVEST